MNKIPEKFNELNQNLADLAKFPGFDNAQQVINRVTGLLGMDLQDPWKLFSDSQGKIRSNATWFMEAEGFADKRASYKIAESNSNNIDLKAYWMKNLSKSIIGWLVALTPNFEDEPFYKKENIGIDFIIPEKADRVKIVLSKNYVIRTLELYEYLSVTQQEIFNKWLQSFDFENKNQVHNALWQSFDLEPVNKNFYKGISGFFVELKQYLSEDIKIFDDKHAAYFTNRLIGRIIFCWFLDKKGIINPDVKYFDAGKLVSSKHYKEKLEPLFFKVFNTPIEEREMGVDSKTPFLNGGLFEIKKNDKFEDPDLNFPKNYFDRLYAFLRHYNFTTDESTSTFQQVAIDPEMLGRIFENLLAEQVEETGEQARKAKGAFYTPREIVDYMCRESLREYLKTRIEKTEDRDQRISQLLDSKPHEFRDQQRNYKRDLSPYKSNIMTALDNIRIVDPACGSGAFPMGMMHLLLMCYERLEPRFDPYKTKLNIVKNNLFGVDVEPMAVEISRLRVWLSIIVDEEVDSVKIAPLPNLDFKFICANSLIPLKKGSGGLFDSIKENDLIQLRDKYFNARTKKSKELIHKKYEKLIDYRGIGNMFSSDYEKQLKTYHPFNSENITQFFDPELIFGIKDKFDLVIANPPYIKEYVYRNAFSGLRDSVYYQGKMDIWYLFACKGIDWLKEKGILTFIAQNNWVTSYGASKMRNKIIEDSQIISLIDFGDFKIFETAGIQTMIMMFKNDKSQDKYIFDYRRLSGNELVLDDVLAILSKRDKAKTEYLNPEISRSYLRDKKLTFSNSEVEILLNKIAAKANFRFKGNEVSNGIHHHHEKVNKKRKEILGSQHEVGNGIFVLGNEEKNRIPFTSDELGLIKPSFTTKELFCWYGNPKNREWVIYTGSSFKNKKKIEKYPNIKKHLDSFREVITSDNKPYGLHRAKNEKFFKGEKIFVARKCSKPLFIYTDFDCYVSATFYIIKTGRINQKYLIGLLNSNLIKFWLRHKGKMQGNNYQIDKEPIMDIPVLMRALTEQGAIIKLVEKIIEVIKSAGYENSVETQAKIRGIEQQIDEIVLNSYELTPEEKAIVKRS